MNETGDCSSELMIRGGELMLDCALSRRDMSFAKGRISESTAASGSCFDAEGLVVLPGMIDLHGDGFEHNVSPRPGVMFDLQSALLETDRQLLINGITTAYLAVTVSWEPGLRNLETARALIEALSRVRPNLITDIRIQLRWEVTAADAFDDLRTWLSMLPPPVLAFNDHFTGLAGNAREIAKIPTYAARCGMTPEQYRARVESVVSQSGEIDKAVSDLAREARALGVTCFAHDEANAETRRRNRALGVQVCEFPLAEDAAEEARANGESVVLGAPNVVRGGSHTGAVDAHHAIEKGLCTVLSSDYAYSALLNAALALANGDVRELADTWSLVSSNAASAVNLDDRGALQVGMRADAIALSATASGPAINAVFVRGKPVFLAEPDRLMQRI